MPFVRANYDEEPDKTKYGSINNGIFRGSFRGDLNFSIRAGFYGTLSLKKWHIKIPLFFSWGMFFLFISVNALITKNAF
jgi:hypothetical protein